MQQVITSLIDKYVRIKREYLITEQEIKERWGEEDEDYDVAPNRKILDVEKVYNGLQRLVDNPEKAIFQVKMDIYGVDLFNYRKGREFVVGSVEPSHQVIIEAVEHNNPINYPFIWDAKYFEVVEKKTYHTWEPIKETTNQQ